MDKAAPERPPILRRAFDREAAMCKPEPEPPYSYPDDKPTPERLPILRRAFDREAAMCKPEPEPPFPPHEPSPPAPPRIGTTPPEDVNPFDP